MNLLERIATKNYEKLSKDVKELYTLDDFIKQIKKNIKEEKENKKWQD